MEQQVTDRARKACTQHADHRRGVDGPRCGSRDARRQRHRQHLDTLGEPTHPIVRSVLTVAVRSQAANKWQWAKILDASGDRRGEDGPCCLAFSRDRMAIAYPRSGVKVWLFIKGMLPVERCPCTNLTLAARRHLVAPAVHLAPERDRDKVYRGWRSPDRRHHRRCAVSFYHPIIGCSLTLGSSAGTARYPMARCGRMPS